MGDRTIPSTNTRTMVLVGKFGSGKSETGNSILGCDTFKTGLGLTGVTTACQMESTSTTRDGLTVNVIDTPGMFRPSVGSKEIAKDREKLRVLASDGIHAVILVLSVSSRFSEEEETTLEWLQLFFGKRIIDYMILAFTGVDLLKKGQNFYDYQRTAPPPLKTIIQMCENRVVQFNNKANDKNSQLKKLFYYVDMVIDKNRGKPYSAIPRDNKVETKLERLSRELAKQQQSCDDADEANRKLKEQAEEKAKELKDKLDKAEKKAKGLKDKLDKAEKKAKELEDETDELQEKLDQKCCCTIS